MFSYSLVITYQSAYYKEIPALRLVSRECTLQSNIFLWHLKCACSLLGHSHSAAASGIQTPPSTGCYTSWWGFAVILQHPGRSLAFSTILHLCCQPCIPKHFPFAIHHILPWECKRQILLLCVWPQLQVWPWRPACCFLWEYQMPVLSWAVLCLVQSAVLPHGQNRLIYYLICFVSISTLLCSVTVHLKTFTFLHSCFCPVLH